MRLTIIDAELDQAAANTVPGMAHWAGSGPVGMTCLKCVSWDGCGNDPGYYAEKGDHKGSIKPRSCRKYQTMMGGKEGSAVPYYTAACKYFEPAAAVPVIVKKW